MIQVRKEDVLFQDTSDVRDILDSFVPTLLDRNRNAITVHLNGYNDDSRELFFIPEVRTWFHRLFDTIPDLFFWMSMMDECLPLYALMMFKPVRVEGGSVIRPEDMQKFLVWGFNGLNEFCDKHDLDPNPSNKHITNCLKGSSY